MDAPVHVTAGYEIEFVWKSVSYDRVKQAESVSCERHFSLGYIYRKLLGHDVNESVVHYRGEH